MVNLLAIDPATETGWATANEVGMWNLKKRVNESDGIKWIRFRAQLKEICDLAEITIIAYERPAGGHTGAVIHHAKLVAIIEEHCASIGIDYVGYSASEIKKKATGIGNCSKQAVIEAAQEKLGYEGSNDNEADALWLYELAADDFGIQ